MGQIFRQQPMHGARYQHTPTPFREAATPQAGNKPIQAAAQPFRHTAVALYM
jgi:hypothetical protein